MKIRILRAYNFVDKDPIIDVVATAVKDSGAKWKDIETNGGPRIATVRNWFIGPTKRPTFPAVRATFRALGKDLAVVDRVLPLNSKSRKELASHWPKRKRKAK